jgi:hypothetical protein
MKKKIILGSIGFFLITLLMTSSATATLQYIDSNIKITKRYEQKLTDAYNNIDNRDFKILIEKIIDLLQTKKVVNSDDIQKIIDDNDLAVEMYIAKGISSNGNWGYCAGDCGWKPIGIIPYIGGIFYWHAKESSWGAVGVNVNVGPSTFTYDHRGLVIGYFGFGGNDWTFDMTYGLRQRFNIAGFGLVILINS